MPEGCVDNINDTMKPCSICNSTDRFPSGPCRPCAKRRALSAESRREYQRKWYVENREKHNHRQRRHRQKHREKYAIIYSNNKRARRGVSGKLSKDIVQRLMKQQEGLCPCCQRDLSDYHIDNIMPITLGGLNIDENVQLLLPECNLKKGAMHPDDWLKTLDHKPRGG